MKKILFVSSENALNNSFGAEQRSNVLLQAFLANGFQVDLAYIGPKIDNHRPCIEGVNIVFWNNGRQWPISRKDQRLRLLTYRMFPKSQTLEEIIDTLEQHNHYTYITCRYLQFAGLAGLFKYASKLILDIDDLPAQVFLSHIGEAGFLKKIYRTLMYKSMVSETSKWILKCKACFLPNEKQANDYGCVYFPNIPVVSCTAPSFISGNKNVLFIGRLDFDPNYRGMDYFICNCWDQIIEQVPDAKLVIAGKGLYKEYRDSWLNYSNIEILGFVDNIIDFYNKGNIVISPITSGAGTNIKVIEALSLGKSCVLSQFSTKGFDDVIFEDINCLVYRDDTDCISKIIKLLKDQDLSKEIGKNAFVSARGKYSQNSIDKILGGCIL